VWNTKRHGPAGRFSAKFRRLAKFGGLRSPSHGRRGRWRGFSRPPSGGRAKMPRRADFFLMLTWHNKNAIFIKRYLFRFNLRLLSYSIWWLLHEHNVGCSIFIQYLLTVAPQIPPCGCDLRPAGAVSRVARKTPPCGRDLRPRGGFYGRPAGAQRASHGHRGEIPKRVRADPIGAKRVNLPAGPRVSHLARVQWPLT
jgi:hypothetical protein